MELKFKRLSTDAVVPTKVHETDSCFDLTAVSRKETDTYIEYGTGIALEIPPYYEVKIYPRSSISKTDLVLCNSVATIDQDYTGELLLRFKFIPRITTDENGKMVVANTKRVIYEVGERVAQMQLHKRNQCWLVEVDQLHQTKRGANGFGHSGK